MEVDSPLFIIGNPRSGTSLLRLLLTCNSQILIPPECGFIIWLHKKYANWRVYDNNDLSRINEFLNDLLKCRKFDTWFLPRAIIEDQIITCQPASYAELCSTVYLAFGTGIGKIFSIWGDKNNYYLNHLDELFVMYKNARFLHIVRDGRDVACSYREVMSEKSISPYAPIFETNISDIALEWSCNVMKVDSFMSRIPSNATMTVKYEHLVSEPLSAIKNICKWLTIPFEQDMLNFYHQNRDRRLEPDLTMDWKRRTLQPIGAETVKRHVSLLSSDDHNKFLNVAMVALRRFSYY